MNYTQNPIWDVFFNRLKDYPEYQLSVLIFGDAIHEYSEDDDGFGAQNRDGLNVVELINSKNNFIRLAQELDV